MSLKKLGATQRRVIDLLAAEPGLTIKALGDRLSLGDVRYASSSVTLLRREGYVFKVGETPSVKNMPQARWGLTDTGLDHYLEKYPEMDLVALLRRHAQYVPEVKDLCEIMEALQGAGITNAADVVRRAIRYQAMFHVYGVPEEDRAVMMYAMVISHTPKAWKGKRGEKVRKRMMRLYPKHKAAVDRVTSYVQCRASGGPPKQY